LNQQGKDNNISAVVEGLSLDADALLNEPINFVDEIMAEGKDKSELSEDELKALARSEERRNSKTVLAEIDKRVSILAGAIVYGAFAAILILLWNILWHIGHWIWMGRKQ
jgi:hypothetical protein